VSDPGRALALTMGEPAGIGAEIALKAWLGRADAVPPFFLIDAAARVQALARRLGLPVPVRRLAVPAEATTVFPHALPVLDQPLAAPPVSGRPDPANAPAVIAAIERAVACVRAGEARAVVTNPIHKKALYDAGFRFPGHTEFLAALAGGGGEPVMMLACPELRVVPVSVHLSLRRAIEELTTDRILRAARITVAALGRDFGIASPRLAVAGLNPHAGEGGALGSEDDAIIAPAVAALRAEGIAAFGPEPPDTLFSAGARRRFDAAICMYHDQALIPLKTLDFDGGVNVTLGLPFVRTSPDHGTALDIAGQGRARPASLILALRMADAIARRRATP
jgi:4-hydroxythreonine-4-phosphate dehydrogenase